MAVSHVNIECKRYGCMKNLLACYANCRYNTRCEELRNEVMPRTEEAAKDINSYLTERGRTPIAIQFPKRGLKFVATAASQDSLTKPRSPIPAIPPVISRPQPAKSAPVKSEPPPPLKFLRRPAKVETIKAREVKKREIKEKILAPVAAPPVKRRARRRRPIKRSTDTLSKRESKTSRPVVMAKKVINASSVGKELSAARQTSSQEAPAAKTIERATPAPRKKRASSGKARQTGKGAKMFIILEGKTATVVDERELMQHLLSGASTTARYFEATEVEARVQIVHKR